MTSKPKLPLNWKELLAIILAIVSFKVDDTKLVFFCLLAIAAIVCWGIVAHYDVRRSFKILLCLAVIEIAFGLFVYLRAGAIEKELVQHIGFLLPGNDPAPISKCPADRPTVYVGQMTLPVERSPYSVLHSGDKPILVLKIQTFDYWIGSVERLTIDKLYLEGDQGQEAVDITDDKYFVASSIRYDRTSRSNLSIFDRGNEIFNIQFLNDKAIKVRGVFRRGDHVVTVTDTAIVNAVGGRILPGTGCWHIQNGFEF
jgi:hypothetical protein